MPYVTTARLFFIVSAMLTAIFTSSVTEAGIRLFDQVATVKRCRLAAITTGKFFPAGGRLVTFYIDGKKIGTTMSGGDGYAFIQCAGFAPGLQRVRAESDGDEGRAYLLLVKESSKILLIHIDDILVRSFFRSGKKDDMKPGALEGLNLFYVTSLLSEDIARRLLRENGYPPAPVLDWDEGEVVHELSARGVNVFALVAPSAILSGVEGIKRKFSFDNAEDAEVIKNWDDLRKKW
jgi:hypothetical protein